MISYIKLLIGVALALFCLKLQAQEILNCGSVPPSPDKQKGLLSNKILTNKIDASNARIAEYSGTKYRFKVKAHAFRKLATSNTSIDITNVSESDIEDNIAALNKAFDKVNFEFVLCGINYINVSDAYLTFKVNTERTADEKIYCEPNDEPGHINIYFATKVTMDGLEIGGKADFPEYTELNNWKGGNAVIFRKDQTQSLIHEMGHFFNLFHTHEYSSYGKEKADGSNCSTAGDKLCDTPADPSSPDNIYFNSSCAYTGPSGYAPLTDNYMSLTPLKCRKNFTSGQISRMQTTGLVDRNDLLIPYESEFNYNIKANYFYPGPGAVVNVTTVASSILSSNSVISEASNIKYYADEKIVLKNGFKVAAGSTFKAKYIDFCDMPNRKDGVILLNPLRMFYDAMEEEGAEETTILENQWMKVYPNPTTGTGSISFNSNMSSPSSVSIFDSYGRKLQVINCDQQSLGTHEINFDLMQYPSGMYSAVMEVGGKVYSSQFVIAR